MRSILRRRKRIYPQPMRRLAGVFSADLTQAPIRIAGRRCSRARLVLPQGDSHRSGGSLAPGGSVWRRRSSCCDHEIMPSKPNAKFPRIIVQYCRQRLASAPPREAARLENYLLACFSAAQRPPMITKGWDWRQIASSCEIDADLLGAGKDAVPPILLALKREIDREPHRSRAKAPAAPSRDVSTAGRQPLSKGRPPATQSQEDQPR
jgi:hypothetical protein